jgi:hypothetical protein
MKAKRKAESDVEPQSDQASSREPDDGYVGRVAPDEAGQPEETGAERRAAEKKRTR